MKRRSALGLVLALTALFAIPAIAPAQMMMGNITGDWHVSSTGAEFHTGMMHLSQQGSTVVGSYKGTTGKTLQVNGKFSNEKLSGMWRGPTGESGWLTLTFTSNGKGFSGEWGYHGRPSEGKLVGTMQAAAKM